MVKGVLVGVRYIICPYGCVISRLIKLKHFMTMRLNELRKCIKTKIPKLPM
jgi:hypothetical protein